MKIMVNMNKLGNLWRKNKFPILFAVIFSVIYITVGCLWFLAPNDKYSLNQPRSFIQIIVPILGLAVIFLNSPLYVFVPALAIVGGFAGLITEFWLDPNQPITLAGTLILIVFIVINYCIGLYVYTFAIMWW